MPARDEHPAADSKESSGASLFLEERLISDLFISIKMETEMLSHEIQKLVTDSALKYFTPEELAERSKFDEGLEFLESVGFGQGTPALKRIQITLEGAADRKITITID